MSKRLCSVTVQLAPAYKASFLELASAVENGCVLEGAPALYTFADGSIYAVQPYWLPADWDEAAKPAPAEPTAASIKADLLAGLADSQHYASVRDVNETITLPHDVPIVAQAPSRYEVVGVRPGKPKAGGLGCSAYDYELIELFDELLLDLSPDWDLPPTIRAGIAAERIAEFSARVLAGEYETAAQHASQVANAIDLYRQYPRPTLRAPSAQAPDFVGVDKAEAGADESVTDEVETGSWANVNDYPTPVEELASFKAQVVDLFAELRADLNYDDWAGIDADMQMYAAIQRVNAFELSAINTNFTDAASRAAESCAVVKRAIRRYEGRPDAAYLPK